MFDLLAATRQRANPRVAVHVDVVDVKFDALGLGGAEDMTAVAVFLRVNRAVFADVRVGRERALRDAQRALLVGRDFEPPVTKVHDVVDIHGHLLAVCVAISFYC